MNGDFLKYAKYGWPFALGLLIALVAYMANLNFQLVANHLQHSNDIMQSNVKVQQELVSTVRELKEFLMYSNGK